MENSDILTSICILCSVEPPEEPSIVDVICVPLERQSRCLIQFGTVRDNTSRPVQAHRLIIVSYDNSQESSKVLADDGTPLEVSVVLQQSTQYLLTVDFHNCAGSSSNTRFFKTNGKCLILGDIHLFARARGLGLLLTATNPGFIQRASPGISSPPPRFF